MINKPHLRKQYKRVGRHDHDCSEEQWNFLYVKQSGYCAVCGTTMDTHGKGVSSATVDHCHASSEIRGLLCSSCNKGIGCLKDDPTIMANAIEYINKHRDGSMWWKLYKKLI